MAEISEGTEKSITTKNYRMVEIDEPITYVKNRWYIGYRAGFGIHSVKCVRGGKSSNVKRPPVFMPTGSVFAFEYKIFDWLTNTPNT